ncbi:MAG: hypothetical protein ABJA10_02220, partial [Aestuariivirga sp.]
DNLTETAKAHNIANRTPLRREGNINDVAEAAMAMLQNELISGEALTVDSGISTRITGQKKLFGRLLFLFVCRKLSLR